MSAAAPKRTTHDYQRADAAHHLHAFLDQRALNAQGARVMVRGRGMYLWDSDGKQYLDGMSGLWCTAVGYARPELIEAATRQLEELSYYNLFFHTTNPRIIELSERLFPLLGERYSHAVYTNSGSEANETLIRVVRRYWDVVGQPQRKILIGRWNGYHGSTVGSASLGGMEFMHRMGDLPIPGVAHVDEPYWFAHGGDLTPEQFGRQAAASLERKILELGPERVAAFVAEPFQGAGGMIFPPEGYWAEIERICRRYAVLLCADEVISGFGRTGEWFGFQHFGFAPDIVSIAKGLTSGYIPMGALVLSRRLAEPLIEQGGIFAHGLTYSGHPVAAAVALANLDVLEREALIANARSGAGAYLQRCLREVFGAHPLVGEVQGAGLVGALQLAEDRARRKRFAAEQEVAWRCRTLGFELGVVLRATLGRVIVAPALIANHGHIDELIEKMRSALERTSQEYGVL